MTPRFKSYTLTLIAALVFWTCIIIVAAYVLSWLSGCATYGPVPADQSLNNMDNMPRLADQLAQQKEFYP